MQANALLSIVLLGVMTLVGCAARALEGPERKPATRGSAAGASPYDYTQNPYSGWGSQPAKGGGGSTASGGSGAPVDGGGGSGAAGGGAGGNAASPEAEVTCPTLTLARAPNGDCVPRVTEYDVAVKPTSIVLGSDGRLWVDDEARNELLQLDDFGQVIARVPCEEGSAPRALAGGAGDAVVLYTSAKDQVLVKVGRSGARSTTYLGFEVSAIALAPSGDLFFSELGKAVHHLSPERTAPTSWRSSPTDALVVNEDAAWFSEGVSLGRLTREGGVEDFFLGEAVYASGLGVGPDSELWFTDGFADQLVQIRADGARARTLNLPTGTSPGRIITGPDHGLWFAETGTRMLGRATLEGELTHYPLPTPSDEPRALVVGSDGNIWFTTADSWKVGRLIPDSAP